MCFVFYTLIIFLKLGIFQTTLYVLKIVLDISQMKLSTFEKVKIIIRFSCQMRLRHVCTRPARHGI